MLLKCGRSEHVGFKLLTAIRSKVETPLALEILMQVSDLPTLYVGLGFPAGQFGCIDALSVSGVLRERDESAKRTIVCDGNIVYWASTGPPSRRISEQ